jgi:hypothetical protein
MMMRIAEGDACAEELIDADASGCDTITSSVLSRLCGAQQDLCHETGVQAAQNN